MYFLIWPACTVLPLTKKSSGVCCNKCSQLRSSKNKGQVVKNGSFRTHHWVKSENPFVSDVSLCAFISSQFLRIVSIPGECKGKGYCVSMTAWLSGKGGGGLQTKIPSHLLLRWRPLVTEPRLHGGSCGEVLREAYICGPLLCPHRPGEPHFLLRCDACVSTSSPRPSAQFHEDKTTFTVAAAVTPICIDNNCNNSNSLSRKHSKTGITQISTTIVTATQQNIQQQSQQNCTNNSYNNNKKCNKNYSNNSFQQKINK